MGKPAKRIRTEEDAEAQLPSPGGLLTRVLQGEAASDTLAAEVAAAAPYPHGVLRGLCDDAFLRRVREEAIDNLPATFKETDLFKMYQTVDMANFSDDDPKACAALPSLLALRRALYSAQFRQFVTAVTGCERLSDKTDCAVNIHAQGGHLLCHDDVIGDRAVSFIIYLVDPDVAWTAQDGGCLELYPLQQEVAAAAGAPPSTELHTRAPPGAQGVPAAWPCKEIVPEFNALAFFNVLPGRSYHAVQEVFGSASPRMSIQGWYHADAPPPGADKASLSLLQAMREDGEDESYEFPEVEDPQEDEGGLNEADLAALRKFVNPVYLSDAALEAIATKFDDDGRIQLRDFLAADKAAVVKAAVVKADVAQAVGRSRRPDRYAGIGDDHQGWVPQGPPIKQRFLCYDDTAIDDAAAAAGDSPGVLLSELSTQLIQTEAFRKLLQIICGYRVAQRHCAVRRFRPGLDFTVAHHGQLSERWWLSTSLCFVDDEAAEDAQAWQSEDVGGFECFLNGDKDGEAATAEVYRPDGGDDDDLLSVCAACNTLTVVLRPPARMHFVKYVSAAAPGSRWDVATDFHVDNAEEQEEPADGEQTEERSGKQTAAR